MMLPQASFDFHCSNVSSIPPTRETLQVYLNDGHVKAGVQQFIDVLCIAVKRCVLCLPRDENLTSSEVLKICHRKANTAGLFSGDINSMVITIFADPLISLDKPIN